MHVDFQQTHAGFPSEPASSPHHILAGGFAISSGHEHPEQLHLTKQLGRKRRALVEFVTFVTAIYLQFLQTGQVWSEGTHSGGAAELAIKAAESPTPMPSPTHSFTAPTVGWIPTAPRPPGHHVTLPKVEPEGRAQEPYMELLLLLPAPGAKDGLQKPVDTKKSTEEETKGRLR